MRPMRSPRWPLLLAPLSLLPLALAGCAEPAAPVAPQQPAAPAYVVPAPQPTISLAVASEECSRLIGSINAGIAHVDKMGDSANAEGKDEFEATAAALESVARAVADSVFLTPDLARLGGFYVGIARQQGAVIREVGKALDRADEPAVHAGEARLQILAKQEDALIEELNRLCRGGAAVARPESASDPAPAPSATP